MENSKTVISEWGNHLGRHFLKFGEDGKHDFQWFCHNYCPQAPRNVVTYARYSFRTFNVLLRTTTYSYATLRITTYYYVLLRTTTNSYCCYSSTRECRILTLGIHLGHSLCYYVLLRPTTYYVLILTTTYYYVLLRTTTYYYVLLRTTTVATQAPRNVATYARYSFGTISVLLRTTTYYYYVLLRTTTNYYVLLRTTTYYYILLLLLLKHHGMS